MLKESEFRISKQELKYPVGHRWGDYSLSCAKKYRKLVGSQYRTYVKVQCSHGEDHILLDNLKRGEQLGCPICYKERNSLPIFTDKLHQYFYMKAKNVLSRCFHPGTNGYALYKDREVHQPWVEDTMQFANYLYTLPDWEEGKTLDRIDNSKGYIPGNLQWATCYEQAQNRVTTRVVEYNNEYLTFKEFCDKYVTSISFRYADDLYRKGATPEELVNYQRKKSVRPSKR